MTQTPNTDLKGAKKNKINEKKKISNRCSGFNYESAYTLKITKYDLNICSHRTNRVIVNNNKGHK